MLFPIAIHLCLGKAFVFVVIFFTTKSLGVATKISHGNAHGSVIKIGSRKFGVGGHGAMVLPPLWVTGDMEAPAGTKNMGSWIAKVRDNFWRKFEDGDSAVVSLRFLRKKPALFYMTIFTH